MESGYFERELSAKEPKKQEPSSMTFQKRCNGKKQASS